MIFLHHFSQQNISTITPFSLSVHFANNIDSTAQLSQIFPYELYLKSGNYKSIKVIKDDLIQLDSIFPKSQNKRILSAVLTNQLSKRLNPYFESYQPDSLLQMLQWAEKFVYYADIDPTNDVFYQSIYQYWLDTISNTLHKFSYEKPSLKYDFKFEYLQTRLKEKGAVPDIKKTSFEKAIDNLIHNKWAHLINASWDQTSLFQKTVFLLLTVITFYGYISIIKLHCIKS